MQLKYIKIRPIVKFFVLAEFLDIIITLVGFKLFSLWELNPLGLHNQMILAKILCVIFVAMILQIIAIRKIYWIIVAVASLPIVWNIFVICTEIF